MDLCNEGSDAVKEMLRSDPKVYLLLTKGM